MLAHRHDKGEMKDMRLTYFSRFCKDRQVSKAEIDDFIKQNLEILEKRRSLGCHKSSRLLGFYRVSESGMDTGWPSRILLEKAYCEYISEFGGESCQN